MNNVCLTGKIVNTRCFVGRPDRDDYAEIYVSEIVKRSSRREPLAMKCVAYDKLARRISDAGLPLIGSMVTVHGRLQNQTVSCSPRVFIHSLHSMPRNLMTVEGYIRGLDSNSKSDDIEFIVDDVPKNSQYGRTVPVSVQCRLSQRDAERWDKLSPSDGERIVISGSLEPDGEGVRLVSDGFTLLDANRTQNRLARSDHRFGDLDRYWDSDGDRGADIGMDPRDYGGADYDECSIDGLDYLPDCF